MFLEVFKSYDVFKSQGVMFLDPNKTDDDILFSPDGWPTKQV